KVGSVFANGQLTGSCFYVDERGYVATTFSNVLGASEVTILFSNGQVYRATGVIEASKGKDIAILKMVPKTKSKKKAPKTEALTLNFEADPQIDEEAYPWGGPKSLAAAANVSFPKITRKLLGQEYVLGLTRDSEEHIGCDPDTLWFWLSLTRHSSCNGGPVFDKNGHVIGMLSTSLGNGPKSVSDPTSQLFSAVHVKHVIDLIPKLEAKPRPLKSLENWDDQLPNFQNAESAPEQTAEVKSSLSGTLGRGDSIASRYADLQRRAIDAEQEGELVAKHLLKLQAANLEILADVDKLQVELNAIQPEEAFTETVKETVMRNKVTTKRERGPDGEMRDVRVTEKVPEEVTRTRTSFRFSALQQSERAALRTNIGEKQIRVQGNQNEYGFESKVRSPFLTQVRQHIDFESFFFADPLGMRSEAEQRLLEEQFTSVIDEGGAAGIVYLSRAICRINLGALDNAKFDLNETKEAAPSLRRMAGALEERISILDGSKTSNAKLLKELTDDSELDPRIWTLAARLEMDSKDYLAALRHLEKAAMLAPHEVEIQLGLAWLSLSASKVNIKQSVEAATKVVRMTAGRDWFAIACLAAAYSHDPKSTLAMDTLEAAIRFAPAYALERCERWRSSLDANEPIRPDW
ncbi:MAG: trypsin-like peptidase domain-containing protein, partial [Pirellula sp.]